MKNTIITLGCFILFALGICKAEAQEIKNTEHDSTRIDKYLSEAVANGFSGAILVVRKGQLVINKGYGFADKDRNILASSSENRYFRIFNSMPDSVAGKPMGKRSSLCCSCR